MDQSRLKVCYVITQRGEKKYWNRVGVAFLNSDGSINVKLESLPVAGDFQIRDYVARDENAGTQSARQEQAERRRGLRRGFGTDAASLRRRHATGGGAIRHGSLAPFFKLCWGKTWRFKTSSGKGTSSSRGRRRRAWPNRERKPAKRLRCSRSAARDGWWAALCKNVWLEPALKSFGGMALLLGVLAGIGVVATTYAKPGLQLPRAHARWQNALGASWLEPSPGVPADSSRARQGGSEQRRSAVANATPNVVAVMAGSARRRRPPSRRRSMVRHPHQSVLRRMARLSSIRPRPMS